MAAISARAPHMARPKNEPRPRYARPRLKSHKEGTRETCPSLDRPAQHHPNRRRARELPGTRHSIPGSPQARRPGAAPGTSLSDWPRLRPGAFSFSGIDVTARPAPWI